jgi:uncharacterized coiled-coil DUF342 family protein
MSTNEKIKELEQVRYKINKDLDETIDKLKKIKKLINELRDLGLNIDKIIQ